MPREQRYAVIEREALAIIWGIQKFKMYLIGKEFVVETDHKPLSYLRNVKNNNGRLMRWSLFLQEFQFKILYIKGSENSMADSLSRNALPQTNDLN